jgi:division protein CdvB (Snf7/Vps24/ESCRT-III family)
LTNFDKQWKAQENSGGFGKQTRDAIRGPQPLKPQIQKATQQLTGEIKKTVTAVQAHDQETSKAYSSELAEVRKMQKIVTQSRIALEQITVRLQTVTEVGDFAATISPAIGVIKSVRASLGEAMPDAQNTLGEIGSQLTSIMTDVGQLTGSNFYMGEPSEEANKILSEAAAIAEKRMSDSLPEVPSSTSSSAFTSSE